MSVLGGINLTQLRHEAEDKAVDYLNETRLDALEEKGLAQMRSRDHVRLHKLEFSALIQAVRGLHRKRQALEAVVAASAEREK